ncbi:hypothetical protein L6452_38773 [Arctium lappa]|uniref:Uncharacterized protein n=1 Tax=Arctium lappa TaxID=4217 RepID=A0ACB8XR81_ARCLA|nr:hypothetical protein L6452_38773 [Arctium lappa]
MAQASLIASKNVKFNISESEVPKNNHLARLDFEVDKYPHLVEATAFLKQSYLAYALNVDPKPSKTLLQQFWFTTDEATITNKKGDMVPAISFTTELGSGMITAYGLRKALRLPEKTKAGFDALLTEAELIQFLDDMEYCWDNKPRSTIPQQAPDKDSKGKHAISTELHLLTRHSKHDNRWQAFDYAGAIFDDLKSKIEKTERDPKIPYVRFICAYLHFLYSTTYPTTPDGTFSKVGQRSLEIKPIANEVTLLTLHTRLSLHSLLSAVTQGVPSPANPVATTSHKRPSASLHGPSKKAKKTKEIATTGSMPEVVSQQTTLDAFVGISSTTSATTISSVPAMTIAVTTTVTPPITSVLQQPYKFSPLGPDNQMFEESMHFYNMFENSGPTLAIVDAHVNTLAEKVESLTTSVNESTSAVNLVGAELKKLTDASSSKDDSSQLTNVQGDIVKIKDDLGGTHQQVQLLLDLYDNLQHDVRDLAKKVDTCTSMLQQVLVKLSAPAPTPTPSFTENDCTSLNVAVEFIHQATSDIPVIEGRLERLEAEV